MIFRKAKPEEFDAVWSILMDGKAALKALGIDQWQGEAPTPAMLQADFDAGVTYVVEDEQTGQLLSTLAFVTTGEADYAASQLYSGAWLTQSGNGVGDGPVTYAALHRVATAANATGRGAASFAFQEAIKLGRQQGLKSLRLDTHHGNPAMQRTSEKNGFVRCCEIYILTPYEPTKERVGYELVL